MIVNRPMLWISASFVAGSFLMSVYGVEAACFSLFCSLILLLVLLSKKIQTFSKIIFLLCYIFLCTGVILSSITGDISRRPLIAFCDNSAYLTGEVTEDVTKTETYIRLQMKVSSVLDDTGKTIKAKDKVLITIFKDAKENKPCPVVNRGDVVTTKCILSLPNTAENTNGFDYKKYLTAKGIHFTAIAENDQIDIIGHNDHLFSDTLYALRNKCANIIDQMFPAKDSGVIKAYILGDKSGMDTEISDSFSASGLSHILAVSGMHVAVFLASIAMFLKLIRFPKKQQRYLMVFVTILYVVFTGTSVSTVRAGIVCVIAIIAKILYRKSDALTALSEAAAILCAANPYIFYDVSFLLSFTASLGIILFSQKTAEAFSFIYKRLTPKTIPYRLLKYCVDLVCVGACANIFMIPVLIYFFKEVSVFSVVATVVISPILSPMLIGGLLLCIVGLIYPSIATPFAGFLYFFTKILIGAAEFFGGFTISKITVGHITPFFLFFYVAVLILLYFIIFKRGKRECFVILFSVFALYIIFSINFVSNHQEAEVSFINVGQGDCSYINAPGNCDILIDAGGKEDNGTVGEKVVKPYLLSKGVVDIEYVIASHGHVDHINGLIDLLEVMKVKHLLVPKGFGTSEDSVRLIDSAKTKQIPITYLSHGDMIRIGENMSLKVIMPDEKLLAFLPDSNENDRSLLLKLEYGDVSFLFTGDLSKETENYVTSVYPDQINADVLKIGHHGSAASNSETFLKEVQATYAYIPVGKNQYGLPADVIIDRLNRFNIQYYRADVHKDVTFYFDMNGIKGVKYDERIVNGGAYELR